jgi:mRNA interferase HigB
LRDFCNQYPDACEPLYNWYRVSEKATWQNLVEVQFLYKSAEAVGNFTVFNIRGNRYRLIVDLIYHRQVIYVKYVLTHALYDRELWKNDDYF